MILIPLAAVAAWVVVVALSPASYAATGAPALPGLGLAPVPGNINSADLNGDGRPDVIAPEFGSGYLAVRINDGRGGFGPIQRYPVGLLPSFVTTGDFNHDGHLDVAVSNAGSGTVSVLLGNGDGTLQPARNYSVSPPANPLLGLSTGSFSLEAADVAGDGNLDLVVSNSVSDNVSVLDGNGDGTFQPAQTYPIAGAMSFGGIPFGMALGDFTGNGHPDIVTGGATNVAIMLNDGSGRFTTIGSYPVGIANSCDKVGDLTGNGKLDIVSTTWGASNAQVLLGNGDGTFRRGQNIPSGGLVAECFSLGDLTGNGKLDLAIASTSSLTGLGVVNVLLGHGDGTFGGDPISRTYTVGGAPWATALGDYNGDGKVDMVVVNSLPPSFSLLLGNGDGSFQPPIFVAL